MRPSAAVTVLLLALTLPGAANATGIYRWVDAEGTVHFGDSPPSDRRAKPVEIRPPMGDSPQADDAESVPEQSVTPDTVTEPGEEAAGD
ncbi:MAG: DUF4124 domain-containing protein [Thioalkalivibrio sp.]|nr:DUF4124 domain-containing protein [Thioalkalivibrio sp.]